MSTEQQSFFEWEDSNPLLNGVPLNIGFTSMGLLLAHDPRLLWEGESVDVARLPNLIGKIRQLFVVTKVAVEFALQFFELLTDGLKARDPRLDQNRARIYKTGVFKGRRMSELPWFSGGAAGMVVEGITGVAKSFILQRVLTLIPQTWSHPASAEYGWQTFTHLIYLVVPMPSSSRQGAFLFDVALAMDKALGTKYAEALRSRELSDDKRAVLVLHWLSVRRCGVLIVEECQERNLPSSVFGSEFLMLFLRAMNWGIPVVVVGNPKALATIKTFTQDGRRFSVGHWFTMEPNWDYRSDAWSKDLVPGIWGWSPMDGKDETIPLRDFYLWKKTGGIPDFLVLLRKESLKSAAKMGRDFVTVADIEAAYKGRAMHANHPLIEALVSFDCGKLTALTDIPAEAIVARWVELGFLVSQSAGETATASVPGLPTSDAGLTAASPPASLSKALNGETAKLNAKPKNRKSKPLAPASPQLPSLPTARDEAECGAPDHSATNQPSVVEPKSVAEEPLVSRPAPSPPDHAAPDQHLDRRGAAYRHLLTRRAEGNDGKA